MVVLEHLALGVVLTPHSAKDSSVPLHITLSYMMVGGVPYMAD